ncbi:tRNA-dihydrouridine synthase [Candidatus Magnetomoraceae bacterium gMMP-15]
MNLKLYLAPIKGITDAIYRNTFSKYFSGFDAAVAPFISTVKGRQIKSYHLKDVLPENNSGLPVIPQIMSNNPDDFINLARCFFDMGYETINWNLGCPYPMVANKKRGSGLLPYPEMIEKILEKVIPAIPNRLSIKTRLGRINKDEIFNLMPVFNKYPLAELIIHPRTGKQMYNGHPDLDSFEKCLDLSAHSVVYNGDINDFDTFLKLSKRFKNVNHWMIGRGALANPFLPGIIKTGQDNFSCKIKKIKNFHNDLFEQYNKVLYGPSHILGKMKGHWFYLANFFPDSRKFLKKIQKTKKIDHYLRLTDEVFF